MENGMLTEVKSKTLADVSLSDQRHSSFKKDFRLLSRTWSGTWSRPDRVKKINNDKYRSGIFLWTPPSSRWGYQFFFPSKTVSLERQRLGVFFIGTSLSQLFCLKWSLFDTSFLWVCNWVEWTDRRWVPRVLMQNLKNCKLWVFIITKPGMGGGEGTDKSRRLADPGQIKRAVLNLTPASDPLGVIIQTFMVFGEQGDYSVPSLLDTPRENSCIKAPIPRFS
jgi:hypothetical protein